MTLHAVIVPKWGLAMQEATLVSWLVEEGAAVDRGQEIAEIESSKIANALEAPAGGVLRRRVALAGAVKAVGALLAVLADADEDDAAINEFIAEFEARFVTEPQSRASGPSEATITVDGHAHHFLKVAATRPSLRAPMVLLHGFGGNHRGWLLNQYELAADRDVYALDLPGHGASSKDVGGGTLEELATRVSAFMGGHGLEAAHLVGHSLGAAVAVTLALDRPQQVKSITAVCGAGFGGPLNREYLDGFVAAARRKDLQPFIELLFTEPTRITRELLDELMAFKRIDGVTQALRLLIDHALSEEAQARINKELGTVRVPIFAIMAQRDRILPLSTAGELPARVCILQSVGHMPQLEAAAELNGLITEFVDNSEYRSAVAL